MPGKGGGLEMPKRGESARLLQELNAQHAPTPPTEDEAVSAESAPQEYKQGITQTSTGVSKALSKSLSTPSSKPANTPPINEGSGADSEGGSVPARKRGPGRTRAAGAAPDDVSQDPPVRRSAARSLTRADKEPVTRLSIDVPESMYNRLKDYVHDKRIESTRALTLALYEDFLTEEGY